jgi:hypothetical protein
MAFNIKEVLIEEIALEGLDGNILITSLQYFG